MCVCVCKLFISSFPQKATFAGLTESCYSAQKTYRLVLCKYLTLLRQAHTKDMVCVSIRLSVCLSIHQFVCVCVCVCVCVHTGVLYGNMNTNVYSFSNSVFQCCCSWTWLQLVNFSTVYMYQWAMPNHLITLPVLVAQRSAPRQPIFAWLISLLHL